jgi:prepilin-type N-terminal cleavage/methylation domain-containing protein
MKRLEENGFSMVEMSVTLAILAILTAIAVPSFVRLMPRMKLTNQTTTLANEIAGLRMQAIARSADFRIVFTPASESYTLEKLVGGAWDGYATSQTSGLDLVSVNGLEPDPPGNILVLFGTGGASVPLGSKAEILLQTPSGDRAKRILVEATGRAVIEKRALDGTWVAE